MTVLAVGAAGTVGPHVITSLTERGAAVRVLTRNAERARTLLPAGIDLRQGDPGVPNDLLDAAKGAGADSTLGWVFPDYEALRAAFAQYMPNWGEGVSYSTRLLGDGRSAVIAMRDSPELFGGEIIGLSAVDLDKEGKVVRLIDYWDSRHFGIDVAAQLRTPADQFPDSFGEDHVPANASATMRNTVDTFAGAVDRDDAAAAAALFTVDASFVDMTLRSAVPGSAAIERFLSRAVRTLPYGSGSKVRHVLGHDAGGGYEWTNQGHAAKRGITALELDSNGLISSLVTVWDSAHVDDTSLKDMSALALDV